MPTAKRTKQDDGVWYEVDPEQFRVVTERLPPARKVFVSGCDLDVAKVDDCIRNFFGFSPADIRGLTIVDAEQPIG